MLDTSPSNLREAIQSPVEDWRHKIKNDFEAPVFNQYPAIQDITQQLYAAGASFSSMSGTGSTVFGIFKKELSPVLSFPESYFQKWV
jgi:4-diphosphocytidyl-2-C-methyl-D-erythritol kinase